MKTLLLILSIWAIVLTGCTQEEVIAPHKEANSVSVAAGAAKELCFESKKDDDLVFRFEADQSLEFNLHYHTDDQVFYPIVEHETAAEKGQYLVPKDDTYCLMWRNNHDVAVNLSADVEGATNITWH